MFTRYAIYAVPDGVWGDFGAAWLGWDNRTAQALDPPHPHMTDRPRKYGFHGTIKPPFRLADDATVPDLTGALHKLCSDFQAFDLSSLRLARIGGFFAMVAPHEQDRLRAVADPCVEHLDRFRAPATEAELAKRRASGRLIPQQDALLERWGYPYVFDEFRFHLTLTGPVKSPETAEEILTAAIAKPSASTLQLDSLCLLGESPDGTFQVIERVRFGR